MSVERPMGSIKGAALAAAIFLSACAAQASSTTVVSPTAVVSPRPTLAPTMTAIASAAASTVVSPLVSHDPTARGFPQPTEGISVYDLVDVLPDEIEADLEAQIDAIEARNGAEIVLYLQLNPEATNDDNLSSARTLMNEWGIGRTGNDGLVILVSFDESLEHGILSTYAGSAMLSMLPLEAQAELRDEVVIPAFRSETIPAGMVAGIQFVNDNLP